MNKFTKTIILVGICLICFSITISGFNFNTLFKPFFNESIYENKEYSNIDDEVNKLVLNTSNDTIKINTYPGDKLKITYSENDNIKYNIFENNKTITINKKEKVCFICLDINFKIPEVIIEIPEDLEITYDIKNSNGKIEISNVKTLDSSFKTSNAKIDARNINSSSSINIKTSNSKVVLDNIFAHNINVKTSNASIEIREVNVYEIIGKTSNGKIKFDKLFGSIIDLKTSNASIQGNLDQSVTEYTKKLKTSNSKIKIDDNYYKAKFNETKSEINKLILETSNGSININFQNH